MIERDATFTADGFHRIRLSRIWNRSKGLVFYTGLNPSRAGKLADDMTVRKGMGFAHRLGYGGTLHGNAYSMITPYPALLLAGGDVLRPENDLALLEMAREARLVVVCWGAWPFPNLDRRFAEITALLAPFHPKCFGPAVGELALAFGAILRIQPALPFGGQGMKGARLGGGE